MANIFKELLTIAASTLVTTGREILYHWLRKKKYVGTDTKPSQLDK